MKNICFITTIFFLLALNVMLVFINIDTNKRLEDFMKHQEAVNSISFETNQKQDKELRIIEQDMDIFWNIVKNKDFIKE